MPRVPSEPLLVRVDPETRNALVTIATSSDRTMSQLVRYATLWWLSNPERACITSARGATANRDEFINVRFARDDMALIREAAVSMGYERGAIIRCAIAEWIAAGDFTALGNPRLVTLDTSDTAALAG